MFTTDPQRAAVVDRLTYVLQELSVGGIATYYQLSQLAGLDVQGDHRYLLLSARKRAEIATGAIYAAARGVGIKRLNAEDSVEHGSAVVRGVRRKCNSGIRRLGHINSNSLSDQQRKKKVACESLLGGIRIMADNSRVNVIAAVIDPVKPIPPKDVLKMFV